MTSWMHLRRSQREAVRPIFAAHRRSFLIDAIVEGHHGEAIVDDPGRPNLVRLAYADIVVLGGDARHPAAAELVKGIPVDKAILPAPGGWDELVREILADRVVDIERYGFSDETLDPEHLERLARRLPSDCSLHRIDADLARRILGAEAPIGEDHVRNFDSVSDFLARGIGYCVIRDRNVVAVASSYAVCDAGIEVQVNSRADHRGRGLATCVSARLIVECLRSGRKAHWDAANEVSARLATRLGYTPSGAYAVGVRVR